jgi:hypothetical protein
VIAAPGPPTERRTTMKLSRSFVTLAVIGSLGTFAACSDDTKPVAPPGTGGTSGAGKGGTAGLGGAVGGSAGTAGSPAGGVGGTAGAASGGAGTAGLAGSAGSAGAAGTAGTAGSAGAAGTAGSAGVSGNAGGAGENSGGEGGEGGVPGCEAHSGTIAAGDASFDEPGSSSGWTLVPQAGNLGGLGDGYARRVTAEGYLCPGALEVTIPFSVYGANEKAAVEKTLAADWSGKTELHVWVKVADPGAGSIAFINGIQVFVQSMGSSVSSSKFVGAATFDDFEWHEIVLDLTTAPAVVLADVNKVGVQVHAATTRPPSAPMTPSTTVIYVDDIYLE